MTKSSELLVIQLINSTEIVNDFGYRFTGYRVSLIVGQLVVLDKGAVFVFAFGDAQIHAYVISVYIFDCKVLYENTCAYEFKGRPND